MRRLTLALAAMIGVALAVYVVDGAADEPHRRIDMSRFFDAGAAAPEEVKITRTPPDPAPLIEQNQWVFDLRWDHGDPWLLGVRKVALPAPQATPRVIGRFALELFEGPTLIERVRFDFPMLAGTETNEVGNGGAEGPLGGPFSSRSFSRNLRTRIGVVFPATPRGTRLELWDRATDRRWKLPWPADAPITSAESSDGGT